MGDAYARRGIVVIDHDRNGTLGRALRDSHDIDIRARQCGKEFRRNTPQCTHAIPNDGDNRQSFSDRQRFQHALFQFEIEFILQGTLRAGAVGLRHAEADTVLRG